MEKVKRFSLKRVMIALALLACFSSVSVVFFRIGEFYETLDDFSGAVSRGDQLAARDYLLDLNYFYELNASLKRFKLNGIARKHLFKDAEYYQAAYDYLTGDHEQVIEKLKDSESYWAHYMRANSQWRLAQGVFEESLKMDAKTKKEMQKKAVEMAYSIKDDYEQAIRKDPDSTLPPKWNYDLVTNPAAMMAGLMPKPLKIKVMLGAGKKKGQDGERGSGPNGKGTLDLDKKGGDKPAPSDKSSPKREG